MSVRSRFLTKRLVGWGLLAAVVLAVVGLGLRPRPAPVDLAAIERGELTITVEDEGRTRVRERFVVSAPAAGKLLRIELEPGDVVRGGETVVAVLDAAAPTPLDARSRAEARARLAGAEAALAQARASRAEAQAQLEYARAESERLSRLETDGIASRQQVDQAVTEATARAERLRAAEYAVQAAAAERDRARAVLAVRAGGDETLELLAPVDGVVLQRLRESETVVAAGEPVLEIGDPTEIEVVADFLSTDAVHVAAGQAARIERWGGDRPLAARVRRVEPFGFTKISALGVEEQRVNVVLDLMDPPEARRGLGDGYRVEVAIVVWEEEDVLKAPTSSLFRHDGGWAVWAAEGGRAALRPVELGRRGGFEAQILSGLEAGERVIEFPSDAVGDGVRIEQR